MACCSENLKNLSKTEQTLDIHYTKFERYLVITAQVSVFAHWFREGRPVYTNQTYLSCLRRSCFLDKQMQGRGFRKG